MYQDLFSKLEKKGVKFEAGLTEEDIEFIEQTYKVNFTKELKEMYSIAMPVSFGFYNWKDRSDENIDKIRKVMHSPIVDILEDIDEVDWCIKWGVEPPSPKMRREMLMAQINSAPELIPIYSHRYLASTDIEQNPVFSISGLDIIYYGENLKSYLEIEFGIKDYAEMQYDKVSYVRFWSDLL